MPRRTLRAAAAAIGAGALVVPFLMATAGAAPNATAKSTLAGTVPTWATRAHQAGTPDSSATVTFRAVLPLRSAAAAERFGYAVSDPSSAQYQHTVTSAQFNARFGPTGASVQSVASYLRKEGFTVRSAAPGNRWVEASGTVSAVNKAFSTTLRTYRYKGHTLRSPSVPAAVPQSLRSSIMTITGLDQGASLLRPGGVRQAPATKTAAPDASAPAPSECSSYWDQHEQTVPPAYAGKTQYPTYTCGYIGDQLQSAYGTKSALIHGHDGHGVTVGIIDAYGSPTMLSDLTTYSAQVGLPAPKPGQYKQKLFTPFNLQTECGGEAGWNGEQTLDVESVHSMAPGANIFYFGAKNCDTGIDDALNYALQQDKVDLISNSYGFAGEDIPAGEINAEHSLFVQAAAEGIGLYYSSGDRGDEAGATGVTQPDYPASDPMVTAVGGTALAIDAGGNRLFETGWGTALDRVDKSTYEGYLDPLPGAFYFGAGGGVSTLFRQPKYQKRVVPDALSKAYGKKAMRTVPDVSAVADPYTGFLVGQTEGGVYGNYAIGGTSLACPVVAGIHAVASQGRKHRIGFANPALYRLAGSRAVYDVNGSRMPIGVTNPSGSYLVTLDRDSSLRTTGGYDLVTGIGSPNGQNYLNRLSKAAK